MYVNVAILGKSVYSYSSKIIYNFKPISVVIFAINVLCESAGCSYLIIYFIKMPLNTVLCRPHQLFIGEILI